MHCYTQLVEQPLHFSRVSDTAAPSHELGLLSLDHV